MTQPPHVADLLAAFADDQLTSAERATVVNHLAECDACNNHLADVRIGMQMASTLPLITAPDFIWTEIEARQRRRPLSYTVLAVAASVLVIAGVAAVLSLRSTPPEHQWEITAGGTTQLVRPGQWIETAGGQQTTVNIGLIGFVDIAPQSRVRMVRASAKEQRLTLADGRIHVKIAAPPRLFQVDTAAGIAVDLGCEYDLSCDRNGNGLLRVTQGWVAYEMDGLESLVPAGASCRTRAGQAPGTPVFDDAPAAFSAALEEFDQAVSGNITDALDTLLASARARDTLTLWHLLTRVPDPASRARVFDRMVSFAPLPAGVSRDAVLALNREDLRRWREELAWTW